MARRPTSCDTSRMRMSQSLKLDVDAALDVCAADGDAALHPRAQGLRGNALQVVALDAVQRLQGLVVAVRRY